MGARGVWGLAEVDDEELAVVLEAGRGDLGVQQVRG